MSNILLPKPDLGTPLDTSHLLARGLVGYYIFNEGRGNVLGDSSLYSNHGVITGATWVGDGLQFVSANSDVVQTPFKPDPRSSTLIFNISFANFDGSQTMGAHDGSNRYYVGISTTSWFIAAGDGFNATSGIHGLSINVRYSIAVVFDGSIATLWKDGVIAATPLAYSASAASTESLWIGARNHATPQYMNATIYDVKYYNRPLSISEIQQLYINPDLLMYQEPAWRGKEVVVAPTGLTGIYYRTLLQGVV